MSLFINAYARLIYSLFAFLLKHTYKQPKTRAFSVDKHNKMLELGKIADKIFDAMVRVVDEKTRHNYTMPVDYEGCKLLIRPFILSEIIMASGLWEPYVKAILDKEVEDSNIIVDVGANIGVYTIPLAKRVSKVIAFEPHPKTSEILVKTIKLNLLNNVTLIKKPIGDAKKKVSFSLSAIPMYSGINTDNNINSIIESIDIESIDLDTALALEDRLDWLIIDVEGFEVNVLNGARSILRKYSPKIIIEAHHVDKVKEILKSEGYSITLLSYNYYYAVK